MKKIVFTSVLALICSGLIIAQDAFDVQSRVYKTALKNYEFQNAQYSPLK